MAGRGAPAQPGTAAMCWAAATEATGWEAATAAPRQEEMEAATGWEAATAETGSEATTQRAMAVAAGAPATAAGWEAVTTAGWEAPAMEGATGATQLGRAATAPAAARAALRHSRAAQRLTGNRRCSCSPHPPRWRSPRW